MLACGTESRERRNSSWAAPALAPRTGFEPAAYCLGVWRFNFVFFSTSSTVSSRFISCCTADTPKATPRNDMKKPHHLPISANCGGGSAYFRCMGKLNQAGKQRLSARIRFASANNIFNFAVCFRRPRYRVFRYRNRPFTTPKTCSTFARTDDFSCSLRFN